MASQESAVSRDGQYPTARPPSATSRAGRSTVRGNPARPAPSATGPCGSSIVAGGAAGPRAARISPEEGAEARGVARTKPADHLGAIGRKPSHGTANPPTSVRTTTRARRTGWRQSRAARLPRQSTINPPTAAWASQRQARTYASISLALLLAVDP